jgi:hypothetical protein
LTGAARTCVNAAVNIKVMIEEDTEEIAYREALRALDRQAVVLSELRQRASIILTGSGIAASLIGSNGLHHGYSKPLAIAAMAVTIVGLIFATSVLLPVDDNPGDGEPLARQWSVTSGTDHIEALLRGKLDRRGLIADLNRLRRRNHDTIGRRTRRFVCAAWLLVGQITLWAVVLFVR